MELPSEIAERLKLAGMYGLAHPEQSVRKRTARSLVRRLRVEHVDLALVCFAGESSPEVYKWLGMALARTGHPGVFLALESKRDHCSDDNARDWLLAAQAVSDPPTAAMHGERMIRSAEPSIAHEACIRLWGAAGLDPESHAALTRLSSESDDPSIRRWALLALHQHGVRPEYGALADNLEAEDFLLREWSLHAIVRFPDANVESQVYGLLQAPNGEHPRVLEWAAHAASAVGPQDPQVDELLVVMHGEQGDNGVREACLGELGRRLIGPAADYLSRQCELAETGFVLASIFSLRTAQSPPIPDVLARQVNNACLRIDESDPGLQFFLSTLPVASDVRAHIDRIAADPMASVYMRARLSRGNGSDPVNDELPLQVGVVVALHEEFRYLQEVLDLNPRVHPISHETYYHADWETALRPIQFVVGLVGRKGIAAAALSARSLLNDFAPDLIISLGLSGALHPKDGALADVVIGESSTAYLENARAQDGAGNELGLTPGTETFRSDAWLVDRATRLDIEHPDAYRAWIAQQDAERLPVGVGRPAVLQGPIAAGPVVVASDAFKSWIRGLNRGFLAVDMETPGVAQASWMDLNSARLLLVRGISDDANSGKDALDASADRNYRKLAMKAAATYLVMLLTTLAEREHLP